MNRAPKIYLAGKISKNDWRHDLVPRLRGRKHGDGPIDCANFVYVGPFFRSCDHGCAHRPGTHGVAGAACDGVEITQRDVFNRNQSALASANVVVAYIEAADCHGTIFEIGFAARMGKRIHLIFAPGVEFDDFWYAAQAASLLPESTVVPRADLPETFARAIADWLDWR